MVKLCSLANMCFGTSPKQQSLMQRSANITNKIYHFKGLFKPMIFMDTIKNNLFILYVLYFRFQLTKLMATFSFSKEYMFPFWRKSKFLYKIYKFFILIIKLSSKIIKITNLGISVRLAPHKPMNSIYFIITFVFSLNIKDDFYFFLSTNSLTLN